MKSTTLLGFSSLSLLSLVTSVSAHGYLRSLTVDGTKHSGNVPNASPTASVIRQVDSVEPVKGATNRAVNCGQNAEIAQSSADASPGSTLTFDWSGGDGSNWPHNTGPMITYLASCDTSACSSFDAINAKWFKVDEAGKRDDGTWVQQDLFNGGTYSMTLPSNLASGEYLVRHEIIALHLATEEGGAEFYPSCSQITVGGNESGVPDENDLVSLPGAYSDTDPGILDPDVFNTNAEYTFPGPEIATLTSTGDSSGSNNAAVPVDSTSTTDSGSSSATASASASASDATSTTHHRMKTKHSSNTATVSDASSSATVSVSATATDLASASLSTITSFAVTSTIQLNAAAATDIADAEAQPPRRLSRIMRTLLV